MHRKDDILAKITEIQSKLDTKLQSTKKTRILSEINSRIGTLSVPSKMPCHSWSIPTTYCKTGSLLAKVEGTPCSKCYAQKGRYVFPNVQDALHIRLSGYYNDSDWSKLIAIRILYLDEGYFRWFDSGDLQSIKMLQDINDVALMTEGFTIHWLPTQERIMVAKGGAYAPNLIIRISSTKIGKEVKSNITSWSSSVTYLSDLKTDNHLCPSKEQGNKCLDCRSCWDKNIEHVVYKYH